MSAGAAMASYSWAAYGIILTGFVLILFLLPGTLWVIGALVVLIGLVLVAFRFCAKAAGDEWECRYCGAQVTTADSHCPKCGAGSESSLSEGEKLHLAEPDGLEQQVPRPPNQPIAREVYREREIIREIVKIRCRNCGVLFEEKLNHCPHCGAPP